MDPARNYVLAGQKLASTCAIVRSPSIDLELYFPEAWGAGSIGRLRLFEAIGMCDNFLDGVSP